MINQPSKLNGPGGTGGMIGMRGMSGTLATDVKGLSDLRQAARANSPEAVKETARQFEAMFMNMVMKSMRDATPQDGIFNNEQSKMYTSMLDQQLSQNMAKRGVGLADVLIRQLSGNLGPALLNGHAEGGESGESGEDGKSGVSGAGAGTAGTPAAAASWARRLPASPAAASEPASLRPVETIRPAASAPAHVREFQERVGAHATEASRTTGIPAKFMLGQAALESGWGRREIRNADGSTSHNLFGIKATGNWKGKVVETMTTEYVNGVVERRVEKFRAYDSYADAFRDYGNLLRNNKRYENVIANAHDAAGFAQGLQRAGYATDPHYAAKLTKIIKQTMAA